MPFVHNCAQLTLRWWWVLQRKRASLMPAGSVWLGSLERPEQESWLDRRRSVGSSSRRSRTRRAHRPLAWVALRGWLPGPEGLLDPPSPPPRDPLAQSELWERGVCEGEGDPMFMEFLKACTPHLGWPLRN